MQKTSEIISMPVYSLFEGAYVGSINSFVFNLKTKKISGFIVFNDDSSSDFFLPVNKIYSIGENSLTIKNFDEISILQGNSIEVQSFIFKTALTTQGNCLGKIVDCFFDEHFSVSVFETESGVAIPVSYLATVGEDVVVFDLKSTSGVARFKPKNQKIISENLPEIKVSILNEKDIENAFPIISNNFNEQSFSKERIIEGKLENLNEKGILFPQKISSSKSIIGKRANKTILGLNGEIVVKDMQVITEKIIDKAKKHSKFFELSNSIEENC